MSKAKDPTLEDDSEQDWEKIFSPGGSKIATPDTYVVRTGVFHYRAPQRHGRAAIRRNAI